MMANTKFLGSPSLTNLQVGNHGFNAMLKDKSVTRLAGDHHLLSERALSMERMPTIAQALAGMPVSPSNNTLLTMQNMQTQASSAQVKAGLLKSPAKTARRRAQKGHGSLTEDISSQ